MRVGQEKITPLVTNIDQDRTGVAGEYSRIAGIILRVRIQLSRIIASRAVVELHHGHDLQRFAARNDLLEAGWRPTAVPNDSNTIHSFARQIRQSVERIGIKPDMRVIDPHWYKVVAVRVSKAAARDGESDGSKRDLASDTQTSHKGENSFFHMG